jgi:hypothetical protein
MESYIKLMLERDKQLVPTTGCRCLLKKGHWNPEGKLRHVLLCERSSNGDFSVLALEEGYTGPLKEDVSIVAGKSAWVDADELEVVDFRLKDNFGFIDWYSEVEEDVCPHCYNHIVEYEKKCPGCGKYNPYHGVGQDEREEEV